MRSVRPIAKKVARALFGERPSAILFVLAPTFLALALDLVLRLGVLVEYPPFELVNYTGGVLLSAGLWGGSLWLAARLFVARGVVGKALLGAFFALFVLPLATFSFPGQALYYRVFHSYMARDTVRLGIALRGTVTDWLSSWGGGWSFVGIGVAGALVTFGIGAAAKRAAPSLAKTLPVIPVLGLAGALVALWTDFVESRALQSALPDACFAHGVMHAVRDGLTGKGWVRRGMSLREPAALPPLPRAAHRPNVLLVVTESVRADALCSVPPPYCHARFLDAVAPDRVPMGELTTQSPGTFSACMMLWTGLPPNADFRTTMRAPVVWELARAVGYRTAYVTSQNMRYDDFHLFVDRAGIDYRVTGLDLGAVESQQIGAPDEAATAKMLAFIEKEPAGQPYFAVLHFSNTHAPYRVDPSVEPFTPLSDDPLRDVHEFKNRYLDSVALQERTFSAFLRELRALPSFDDTVVLFVSDHGEQFREHGSLYHIHSLYDEEVRIPGFVVAGAHALAPAQLAALHAYLGRRTYSDDVNATVLDLLGVLDARSTLPYASLLAGRSLLRPPPAKEPIALLSTKTGVWEPDSVLYGAMEGQRLVVDVPEHNPICYRLDRDPSELQPRPGADCGVLGAYVKEQFPELSGR